MWRRGRDSNPRWASAHSGFQDRRLRPLGHLSRCVRTILRVQKYNIEINLQNLPGKNLFFLCTKILFIFMQNYVIQDYVQR